MEQRRLRLGDNIDDYCPRERRLTTHAIVAMVGDAVKQTRCTTCDAEHVYKGGKVPQRRKAGHEVGALVAAEGQRPGALAAAAPAEPATAKPPVEPAQAESGEDAPPVAEAPRAPDDEGPAHRRLIRAVLPRADGHVPVRQMPEFTMRQPGVRHPDLVNGNGRRGQENGNRAFARSPFKGGQGRQFSRQGKGGRAGAAQGAQQAHGQRHGRHAGRGKKRSR